jgi:hypothetical protein
MTGGSAKPWQIVVIAAAVVAVGVMLFYTLRSGDSIPHASDVLMVDVTTGDLYRVSLSSRKVLGTPERNPDSGKLTLFKVNKSEDGRWTVLRRDLGALSLVEGDPKALDRQSGEVKIVSETAKAVR